MTNTNDKRPTHALWQVNGDDENARWTRIGAAWPNKDGAGFSIRIEAVPLSGRVVMRTITEKDSDEAGQTAAPVSGEPKAD